MKDSWSIAIWLISTTKKKKERKRKRNFKFSELQIFDVVNVNGERSKITFDTHIWDIFLLSLTILTYDYDTPLVSRSLRRFKNLRLISGMIIPIDHTYPIYRSYL